MGTRKVMGAVLGLIAAAVALGGCASAPQTRPDQRALEAQAEAALASMVTRDPSLAELLADSAGYVVFPRVTEAAFIVAGAQAVGVVYEGHRPIGYAELRGGSLGLQVGGQASTRIVALVTQEALDRLRAGNFDIAAGVTATLITSGAAAHANIESGVAVFIDDETGAMAGVSVGGESISFVAK